MEDQDKKEKAKPASENAKTEFIDARKLRERLKNIDQAAKEAGEEEKAQEEKKEEESG